MISRPVGNAEVAKALGWSKARVSNAAREGKLPAPLWHLACGPIWDLSQIRQYQAKAATLRKRG